MEALFHHVCGVACENGKYRPQRFTDAQIEALGDLLPAFGKNARCSAGISLKFETVAEEISFQYQYTVFYTESGGFDVYENGVLRENRALPKVCETGRFVYRKRSEGKVLIEIFLPANAEMVLWDFALGEYCAVPKSERKIVFYGDSLSQSAYTVTPSLSFPTLCARQLGAEYLNRGIGSLFYDASYLLEDDFAADTVMVQFGGNDLIRHNLSNKVVFADGEMQYCTEEEVPLLAERVRAYFAQLLVLYPNAKRFVSTRIPHDEVLEGERKRANDAFNRAIRTLAPEYGMHLIEGERLIPNLSECRVKDGAHFSALGGAMAALALAKYLK